MTMASMRTQCQIRDAVENIECAVDGAGFSMKILSKDQLDQQFYDEDKDPGFAQYIQGGATLYLVPRGVIVYTNKNAYRMACANLHFMINNFIIPIDLTNIPEICNVKRNDGRIHCARILWNEGIFYNKKYEDMMIRVSFYNDETKTVVPRSLKNDNLVVNYVNDNFDNCDRNEQLYNKKVLFEWGTMTKGVLIKDFMEVNKIKNIELRLQTVDAKHFVNDKKPIDKIYKNIIDIFNTRLKEWIFGTLTKKLIQSNVSATIFLDGDEIFRHNLK